MARSTPHHPMWAESPVRIYLHALRKQHGMTQAHISKELGYATSQINAWERGYIAPSIIQLMELVSIFEMKLALVPNEGAKLSESGRLRKRQAIGEQS